MVRKSVSAISKTVAAVIAVIIVVAIVAAIAAYMVTIPPSAPPTTPTTPTRTGVYIKNPEVDELIEKGIMTIDPAEREKIYYTLQKIYYEDVPSVVLVQPLGRHWERTWVQGWYYNPAFPGTYFYALSKSSDAKNPDTMIVATIGEPETLDPAWAYDTASGEIIFKRQVVKLYSTCTIL